MNNKIIFHFFVFTEQRYSIQKNNLRSLGCTFWMEKTPLFCYLSSKMMFFLNVSAFYFIKKKKLEVQPRTTLSFATLTAVNELPFFFFLALVKHKWSLIWLYKQKFKLCVIIRFLPSWQRWFNLTLLFIHQSFKDYVQNLWSINYERTPAPLLWQQYTCYRLK